MDNIFKILSNTSVASLMEFSAHDLKVRVESRRQTLSLSEEDYVTYLGSTPSEIAELCFDQQSHKEYVNMLDSISQNVNEGIFRSELDQGLVYVNDAFVSIFGYSSREELLNGDPISFYADSKDRQNLQDTLMREGSYSKREIRFRRKNGKVFWGMISSICTQDEDGYTWFDGVVTDISDRIEAEQTLRRLNKELTKQNKMLGAHKEALRKSNEQLKVQQAELEGALKTLSDRNFELDQLVYKVSHDLRAPLSSVSGLLNLIKLNESDSSRSQYIDLAEMRLAKLDGFIRSMLTYAKANRAEITEEPIDFQEIINESLQDLEYLPQFSRMKIYANINLNGLAFYGDKIRLQIVLSNIISNAFKYMNLGVEESHLKIDIYPRKGMLHLLLEDNGLGIEDKYLQRVFEMFFRASNNSEGSGLGLYLVKQTVALLNGKIDFWSKPNKGTIFSVRLPMKAGSKAFNKKS